MPIQMVKVRARIVIGNGNLIAATPPLGEPNHILSFNVDKARGQISSFSASLRVRRDEVSGGLLDDSSVSIWAGTESTYDNNKIFTGVIRTATVTPNRDDPEFVILNISGNDILSKLNGKKFTRRCRSTKGVWVSIDNVSREGLRDGKLSYEATEQYIGVWGGEIEKVNNITSTRAPNTADTVENADQNYVEKQVVIDAIPEEKA